DQAIAYAQGRPVALSDVEAMLGGVGRQVAFDLLDAVARGDAATLVAQLAALDAVAPDYEALLNDIAGHLQRIALLQAYPGAQSEEDDAALPRLAAALDPEDVQVHYEIAIHGRHTLVWAPD